MSANTIDETHQMFQKCRWTRKGNKCSYREKSYFYKCMMLELIFERKISSKHEHPVEFRSRMYHSRKNRLNSTPVLEFSDVRTTKEIIRLRIKYGHDENV